MKIGRGTQSSTMTSTPLSETRMVVASPINTWYPLMLQLGGLLSQVTKSPIYSWADWSNLSKLFCSSKQQHQIGITLHQTGTFQLPGQSLATWLCCLWTNTHTAIICFTKRFYLSVYINYSPTDTFFQMLF